MKFQLLALPLLAVACIQVEPKADFERARALVEESTGEAEVFNPYRPTLTDEEIATTLADGLTLDESVQLALLNNRQLQADFMEIGIAHADWVQSRLLSNPSIDLLWRFPSDDSTLFEAAVGQELTELWRLSGRKRSSKQSLDATVLRIARRAGELVAETKQAYFSAVGARELHEVTEESLALVQQTFDTVKAMHEAGSADTFDENLARGQLLTEQLAVRRTRLEAATATRNLASLLSVDIEADDLHLTDELHVLDHSYLDPVSLIELARSSRLDLRALAAAVKAAKTRVKVEERSVWNRLEVGPAMERPNDGSSTLRGPGVSLDLPIFDQNQAGIARAEFELAQLVKLQEAAHLAIAQDVRTAIDTTRTAAGNHDLYERELLPLAEENLALARESYSVGRSTFIVLLEVQRTLLEIRKQAIESSIESASATASLERVVGTSEGVTAEQ
jgi:cobalt-zinc-cadmium efflux system outer membrane protein